MNILVLGGTRFLGRHLVEVGLSRGHTLTLFHRGQTNPDLFPGVERVLGDRAKDLALLQGRTWDVVIDTCGYVPRIVRTAVEQLSGSARYIFISSVSVYDNEAGSGELHEGSPVGILADPTREDIAEDSYGPLKALCEQVVKDVFQDRALIVRPGLIVGPADPTDRFAYWPRRIAQGGEVLAPDRKDLVVQFIDVRDLASWIIHMAEDGQVGTYNATGPDYRLTLHDFLVQCQQVIGSDASFTWVSESFLDEQGVQPWRELPIWVPTALGIRIHEANIQKAIQAGLSYRSLAETIRGTLAWERNYSSVRGSLKPERERELLQMWHSRVEK